MRIAYIITRSDSIGGAHVHVRDLAQAMIGLGHDVCVLVGGQGPFTEELEAKGIPYYSIEHLVRPINPYNDLLALKELCTVLRKVKPDLISTHSSKAGWLGRVAGKILGIPTLFTAHGWAFTEGVPALERYIYLLAEKMAAPLATKIITVSEYDRRLALKYRVASAEKIITVHNGMPDVSPLLRAKPDKEPPKLIMVARFEPPKDHFTLFKALAQLKDLKWELDLVGDGPLRREAEKMVSNLGLKDRVRFLGSRKDVPELLAQAQIFLLISKWEGLPRSIIEAMRAGLPVIASDVGGVRELVVENETGFLIPIENVGMLVQRMRFLLVNSRDRMRMGDKARKRYETKFTFNRMFAENLKLYEKNKEY